MGVAKRVRIIKKIRESSGVWRFISLKKAGTRYAWDNRAGSYFVEWWEGTSRRRQLAGQTPSEAMECQRRKRNDLAGESLLDGKKASVALVEGTVTPLDDALAMFLQHVRVHSPDKPGTVRRYAEVLDHISRILGKRTFVESILGDFKTGNSRTRPPEVWRQ